MSNSIRMTLSGMLVCALSACGGGGGGGGSTPGGTASTSFSALALTTSNAEPVSSEVAAASSNTVGAGDIGSGMVTGVVVGTGDRPALSEITRWSLGTLHGLRGRMVGTVSGVVINEIVACTSGSVSVSWNDADNDSNFSSGDSFSMTFNNCVEMGVAMNGSLALSGFTVTGDPSMEFSPWSMGASFTFTAFTMNDGIDSARIDGGMSVGIATPDGDDFEVDIGGTSLAYRIGGYTTTLRDFAFSYTEVVSSGAFSLDYAGTLDIGSLAGRVSFTTTAPFTGSNILEQWPEAGTLLMTGANASTLSLQALGGDNVRISVDANGDGGVDQTIDTTWTALAAI